MLQRRLLSCLNQIHQLLKSCILHSSKIKFTKVTKTYFALCSADSILFSSAWSLSISFFFLSIPRSASIAALACVSLSLLYSFFCSSSCCFSLCKENTAGLNQSIHPSIHLQSSNPRLDMGLPKVTTALT